MTDFILPRSLESAYQAALQLLTDGVEEPVRRCHLVGVVRDYVEKLESTANRRGQKLKELATQAAAEQRRRRELAGRFLDGGRVFAVEVPPYDFSWLGDLVTEPEVSLALRSERLPDVPLDETVDFVVVERAEPGDLVLVLRVLHMGETPEGRGEARFGVVSMSLMAEPEEPPPPGTEPP